MYLEVVLQAEKKRMANEKDAKEIVESNRINVLIKNNISKKRKL